MPERLRAVILAPYRQDAAILDGLASAAGAEPRVCQTAGELRREVDAGCGVVILSEEGCTVQACNMLAEAWRDEPPWSSPTLIVLLGRLTRGPVPLYRLLARNPAISCLKLQRPVPREMLLSAIRNQLDHRDRQLQIRDLIKEVEAREERQRFLRHELDHRVKNLLANLGGLLKLTAAGATDVRAFVKTFEGRVAALSRIHDRLSARLWDRVPLSGLVEDALRPYLADPGQLEVVGPAVLISPRPAVSFTMALHELATNASKYGALSGTDGRVHVNWSILSKPEAGELGRMLFEWREAGGPPVAAPEREGFGTRLVRHVMAHDLGGELETLFRCDGVYARMEIPIRQSDPLTI